MCFWKGCGFTRSATWSRLGGDLPATPFEPESFEDEDDSNDQLQKQKLFQYNPLSRPQRVFAIDNVWPLQDEQNPTLAIWTNWTQLRNSEILSIQPFRPLNHSLQSLHG